MFAIVILVVTFICLYVAGSINTCLKQMFCNFFQFSTRNPSYIIQIIVIVLVQYLHIVCESSFTGIVKIYFPQAIIRKSHGSPDAMYCEVIIIKRQISKAGEQCIQQKSTENKGEYSRHNMPDTIILHPNIANTINREVK